jgi:hypothetical protein
MPPRTIAPPDVVSSSLLPPPIAPVAAPLALTKQRLNIALCIVLVALIFSQKLLTLLSIPMMPLGVSCLVYPLADTWQPNASGIKYWYALPGSTPCCCSQNGVLPGAAPLHFSPQENPTPPAKTGTVGCTRKSQPGWASPSPP